MVSDACLRRDTDQSTLLVSAAVSWRVLLLSYSLLLGFALVLASRNSVRVSSCCFGQLWSSMADEPQPPEALAAAALSQAEAEDSRTEARASSRDRRRRRWFGRPAFCTCTLFASGTRRIRAVKVPACRHIMSKWQCLRESSLKPSRFTLFFILHCLYVGVYSSSLWAIM